MAIAHLFHPGNLSEYLRDRARAVRQQLLVWSPDLVLGTPEDDLMIKQLRTMAVVECPELLRGEVFMEDPVEIDEPYAEFGPIFRRRVTCYTLVVPFTGDPDIFRMRPQRCSVSPPTAELLSDAQQLRLVYDRSPDSSEIRAHFDHVLDDIDRHLTWARDDIRQHQWTIDQEVPRLVSERRAKLLADRETQANIGFPIRRRQDAATYAVPVRRKRLVANRPARTAPPTTAFEPEPALADEDYEGALAVLRDARNALERTPSVAAGLGEEAIRDFLLVFLNAQFKGAAAGEVFNRGGKTDILIRVEDANVFIGECKIWKGPKTVSDALDQLLGYLVWRDTKAALLLFIRDGDVSAVTQKAVAQIESHPNYKHRGRISNDERHDFIVHTKDDTAREIQLALLPFLVPKRA